MTKHISFPSIEQFRSVIKHITDNCKHHQVVLPILTFTGTVKLHGTNHGVCRNLNDGTIYTQSRERITAIGDDNAGSAAWTLQNIDKFQMLFNRIDMLNGTFNTEETTQIFGEWCGGSIQKGVGLNKVDRQFIVFAIRVSIDSESQVFFTPSQIVEVCKDIMPCSYDFPSWHLDIDFNKPELAQAKLIELTEAVEKDCPVARQMLGADFKDELIGEGIVWTAVFKGNTVRFKVKGEKHSSSKVKVLAAVDVEKMASIREFVAAVVTESRLTQGLEHITAREPKYTGEFLKWVMSDIFKEESDTMVANGFTSKEVSGSLSTAIRQWFLGVQ